MLPSSKWYYGGGGRSAMSLATAIIGSDGIVIASDSKETEITGAFQGKNVQKIEKITNSVWVVCASNYVGFTNRLIDDFIACMSKLKSEEQGQLDVVSISKEFARYANHEYTLLQQDQQKTHTTQPLEGQIEFIFAGYTAEAVPRPRIITMRVRRELNLPPFMLEQYPEWVSGMAPIAEYWLYKIKLIKPLNSVNTSVLKMLTLLMFIETMKVTALVGGTLNIVIIKPKHIADEIAIPEVDLERIRKELDSILGEQRILDELTRLASNDDLTTN
jgi:hypothetical protein